MKLYRKQKCLDCDGVGRLEDIETPRRCDACSGNGYKWKEVDPADLDKMNLAALWVLGELKKRIARDADQAVSAKDINLNSVIATYDAIETMIADLESAADLKVPEMQEELLKACELGWHEMCIWESSNECNCPERLQSSIAYVERVLAQARADLALPTSAQATDPAKALRQSSG